MFQVQSRYHVNRRLYSVPFSFFSHYQKNRGHVQHTCYMCPKISFYLRIHLKVVCLLNKNRYMKTNHFTTPLSKMDLRHRDRRSLKIDSKTDVLHVNLYQDKLYIEIIAPKAICISLVELFFYLKLFKVHRFWKLIFFSNNLGCSQDLYQSCGLNTSYNLIIKKFFISNSLVCK